MHGEMNTGLGVVMENHSLRFSVQKMASNFVYASTRITNECFGEKPVSVFRKPSLQWQDPLCM